MLSPKFSIVMPVFNSAKTIEKAILSVLAQTYQNHELIIVDGGSTDGTVDIIKKYESQIAYWHSKPDRGPIDAANIGITLATGDLVSLLMADDWYEPKTLEETARAFSAKPDADIYTCAGDIVTQLTAHDYKPLLTFYRAQDLALTFYNICYRSSAICCRFIKKSFFTQNGLYDAFASDGKPMLSNDKKFLLKAVIHHAKDVFVPYVGYHYLAHAESSTFGGNVKNNKRLLKEHVEIANDLLSLKNLKWRERLFLIYWYNDQSARLIAYELLDKNFPKARSLFGGVCVRYHIVFLLSFLLTTFRVVLKSIITTSLPIKIKR